MQIAYLTLNLQNNHFQHSKSSFTHFFTFSYSPHFYKYIHTNKSNKAIPRTNTFHISTIRYYRQITYNPYSLHWFLKRQYGSVHFQPTPFFHFIFTVYSTSAIHSIHTIITKHTLTTLTSIFPNHFIQLHLLITNTLLLFKTYSFSDSTSSNTHSMHLAVFYSLSPFHIYTSIIDKCQIEFERSNSRVDLKPRMVLIYI